MKKAVYLFFSTVLGVMLSFIVHAGIEYLYLKTANEIKWTSVFGKGSCALPVWLQLGLLIVGINGGFLLGLFWWRMVYIEKKHWRKKIQ